MGTHKTTNNIHLSNLSAQYDQGYSSNIQTEWDRVRREEHLSRGESHHNKLRPPD